MKRKYKKFYEKIIINIDKKRVFTDDLTTFAYGTDASFYRLTPKIVIKAIDELEIIKILKFANIDNLPITFKAAGTSLSGQTISDSILVICSFGWKNLEVLKNGNSIKLQPGVIGSSANNALKFFNKKIGPDPASINSAMIGGIASNNASGMCCGIDHNSYKTLKDIKIIFANGQLLDTSDTNSILKFKQNNKIFIDSIKNLSQSTKKNIELKRKINKKYSIKNTMGYSLNALIDFEDEIDIVAHLMIGSEGTLGFISSITYNTIDEPKLKASSLILFDNIYEACKFAENLKSKKDLVLAAELMDRASLKSVENKKNIGINLENLHENVTSILIECTSSNKNELHNKIKSIEKLLKNFKLHEKPIFLTDPIQYTALWAIRKGIFPSVGASRIMGTTVIIEDVAFPIKNLADAIVELQRLFHKYNYHEATIFGHILDGNIHFVFTQNFSIQSEIKRYENFMKDVCNLVALKYNGSLKAEHGTGRNMAPFLELEWGKDAYELMKNIKNIFDPKSILNPGVIINNNQKVHIENLKSMTPFNDIADPCIECGFCEPVCPSKDLTLTPRQRITINREIQNRKNNNQEYKHILKNYQYFGQETCAADGLCEQSCPVGINTGQLTKNIKENNKSKISLFLAHTINIFFPIILYFIKIGFILLNFLEKVIKPNGMRKINNVFKLFPYWYNTIPKTAKYKKNISNNTFNRNVVFFSSCINRTLGSSKNDINDIELNKTVESLLKKAKYNIKYIQKDTTSCCGLPFHSKGFTRESNKQKKSLLKQLNIASNYGKYPILFDTSPCAYEIKQELKNENLKIYEPIEFSLKFLVPNLKINQTDEPIVIHTTCSAKKMNLENEFLELSKKISKNVFVPIDINCCGFAGDKGFSAPQLNTSALQTLNKQINYKIKRGFSTSKTCEIGLGHHAKIEYFSILSLLNECSS